MGSALNDLSELAFNANTTLSLAISDYNKARERLASAYTEQGVMIRALAAVDSEHEYVKRGCDLEMSAVTLLS